MFADDHKTTLAAFQGGESVFVWGRHKDTGDLWYLEEDEGALHRPFVKEFILCPVPGCAVPLTSAHRAKKRDGLQHLSGTGGHSRESVFHSQGCALIESWLNGAYPSSRAVREEYTNEEGERRADVLLTSPGGHRVAFEIQYSPLTPEQWQRRHDSYRAQGIVDVWLFGHTSKQLKLSPEGRVSLNPTHEAVLASGSALFFINPELALVGVTIGEDHWYDIDNETPSGKPATVLDGRHRLSLSLRPLTEHQPSIVNGLTSPWLDALYTTTARLREYNAAAPGIVNANKARKAREKAEKHARWVSHRAPAQKRITEAFSAGGTWHESAAPALIDAYFSKYLLNRIDRARDGVLLQWQSVLYFEFIAGRTEEFTVSDVYNRLVRRGVGVDPSTVFKDVSRYLHELTAAGFLTKSGRRTNHPRYVPTMSGAWW